MPGYDYSLPGYYFITINVHNRVPVFGTITSERMEMNEYCEIVKRQWLWLGEQYEYMTSDAYVIMPDHLHGIVVIHDTVCDIPGHGAGRNRICKDNSRVVPTVAGTSSGVLTAVAGTSRDNSRVVPTSPIYDIRHNLLSKTINAFKTTSSKHIHLAGCKEFRWQRSFYDRVIRNQDELNAVRNYIMENPSRYT